MSSTDISIVILAAGKGTRMNSDLPKVVHKLSNIPLICHVTETAITLKPKKIVAVIGHQAELVIKALDKFDVEFCYQRKQKGTAHAVKQAEEQLSKFKGNTIVLSGDVPLIKANTLKSLIDKHLSTGSEATLITADLDNPSGYGRVIRSETGNLLTIREDKDCNSEEKRITEINAGIYIFNNESLFRMLPEVENKNVQSEYYLPDVLTLIIKRNGKVAIDKTKNITEIQGVNTPGQLKELEVLYEKN